MMTARVTARRFVGVQFTDDPQAQSVLARARQAAPAASLTGLFDLGPLNAVLRAAGLRPVSG
jgi:hypothetical protein